MEVRVPEAVARQLVDALTRASTREVGGVMMGEHVESKVFRVVEVSVQQPGTMATFVRAIWGAVTSLRRFFTSRSSASRNSGSTRLRSFSPPKR